MNENTTPLSRFSAWLPVASLALSAAAFALGAPARLARAVHRRPSPDARYETMRGEPDLFPMPVAASRNESASAGFGRLSPLAMGRELAALR